MTVPAVMLAGGAVLGGVVLTSPGQTDPGLVCATGLLTVGSASTFLLLRERAQQALEEAALIRRLRDATLTPTNAGQPAQSVRMTYRKVEQPWLPKRDSGDPTLTALLAAATAGTDIPHSAGNHDHGSASHHPSHDHSASHSHSSFDHSASHVHVHVDVGSF